MVQNPSRLGPVVSVTGAALLALSVFLPWYSVSITAGGAAYAQQALDSAAQTYGNANLQAEASAVSAQFATLAGRHIATVSAHELLKTISVVLLVLAGVAFLGALLWLAEISAPIQVDGGQVAVVGSLAVLLVLFRMIDRPSASIDAFSLSLSWGIWLALLSSAATVAGALVGRSAR